MSEGPATDEDLADLLSRRDQSPQAWHAAQDACAELYRRHARKLLAFLAGRVRRSDLDDVHQEVWERVWRHLPERFRGGNFRAWLYQIARNYLVDRGRKKGADALRDEDALPSRGRDQPDERLLEQERMTVLSGCLEKLDARAAGLVRARLAGESYEEICPRLGLPHAAAHKLFHLAKEQLQTCVERATR